MKILLVAVNAKFIHTNPAVRSLRAYVATDGEETEIVEYTVNQLPEKVLADLYRRAPDVIAFSCYIWNRKFVFGLLKELPKVLPRAEIWLGGPEVSYDAEQVLREMPWVRGIMVGEGEETFRELCRHWRSGKPDTREIAGCVLSTAEGIRHTGERAPVDMDALPFIYRDMTELKDRIPYYESSRGCPFRCTYCLSSIEKTVRFRSLTKVLPELQFFLEAKVPQVKFIDRTFNCDHKRCLTIWRYLKENDNGITNFHFEISADLLNDGELELLCSMRPGLVQLEIGVQTTHPETVTAIRRSMDLEKLKKVVERLRKAENMHIHLDLIAGLPEEDLETFRKSFDEVFALKPHDLQLGFLKVLKGSPMESLAAGYDLKYQADPPYEVLGTRWLGYGELLELKGVEEMLELYHNSGQYSHLLPVLIRESESAYAFFRDLAEWYREHGYEVCQPSRMTRFEILLDFAASRHPEKRELYAELLTYDCWLRERCKKRPDFCPDLTPYRDRIRNVDARPEDHTEVFRYAVWEAGERDPRKLAEPAMIVFMYDRRSPLDNNAAWRVITDE